jgi:hypothetical protein
MASGMLKVEFGPATKALLKLVKNERIPEYIRAEYAERFQIDSAIEKLEKQLKEG